MELIEINQAIEDAKFNAKANEVNNVEFICGKSEDVIPDLCKNLNCDEYHK